MAGEQLILVEVQWIHSKISYLKNVIQKWDEHIEQKEEEHYEYIEDLKALSSPFTDEVKVGKQNPVYSSHYSEYEASP